MNRATRETLAQAFTELGIYAGAVIGMHSALSKLGHLVEGPASVVLALQQAVPGCTIMMPTFPSMGATLDYVSLKTVYDARRTPSQLGLLTEVFRQMPGVRRSLHPTHPCAALGPRAEELIAGSELSVQPFDDSSTFGRFSERDDAVLLLIETNTASICHRLQELVNWPNLFLPGLFDVRGCDVAGQIRTYRVRVHTPVVQTYIFVGENCSAPAQYLWLPHYMIQFPSTTAAHIAETMTSATVKQFLTDRQSEFFETGVFRRTTHNRAEILAIRVKPWQDRLCRDVCAHLAQFESSYALDHLQLAHDTGLFIR